MQAYVEELFHFAADLSPADRARFLDECEIDPATRREVEALLAYDSPPTTSLEGEIRLVAERALERFGPRSLRCGPYRLGDVIGWGGMGAVYTAERVDGEIAQRVALKLLPSGSNDPRLRQRFLAERQILAALSHPNIARLLDAGHREDGQPYLAMEYVEGKPIDAYAAGLDLRRKIALFLKVCHAVEYLHANLLVHSDLKPANILVNAAGEPKLLDFGIAKTLHSDAGSGAEGMRMLTPEYASPEQVAGGPVTTATDIYSLGAVLYKLLTGSSPHRFENEPAEAIVSAICGGRISPPSALLERLRGDLEAILIKALRTEPRERYATIAQLVEDLENFLQSRPIRARERDVWYRTRKFLGRNRLPAMAAAFAVASLATGLTIALRERAGARRRLLEAPHSNRRHTLGANSITSTS